jgi:hypothetical protein
MQKPRHNLGFAPKRSPYGFVLARIRVQNQCYGFVPTHVVSKINCRDRRAQSFRLQMCILANLKQRIVTQSSLLRLLRTQRVQKIVITMSNVGRDVAGTSTGNDAADPPAERAEGEAAPSANERAGRGLGWNTAELLSLCSSGLTADRDSVRGAGIKKGGERAQAAS